MPIKFSFWGGVWGFGFGVLGFWGGGSADFIFVGAEIFLIFGNFVQQKGNLKVL